MVSNVGVQIIVAVAVAVVLTLFSPRLLGRDIATWHYFMSAVFQGLAALVSVSLLAFFFFHERTETRIQALKNDCVEALQRLSTSYPNYFDEGLALEKLEGVRSIMRDYERIGKQYKEWEPSPGEIPSKEDFEKAAEQWDSWDGPYHDAKTLFQSLNREETEKVNLPALIRNYVVPIFVPLAFSLLVLANTMNDTNSDARYTFSMLSVLLLTLLVIARFGYALSTGIHTQTTGRLVRGLEPQTVAQRLRALNQPIEPPVFMIEWDAKDHEKKEE